MKKNFYPIIITIMLMYGINVKAEDLLVFYDVDAHYQSKVENHPEFTEDLRILNLEGTTSYSLEVDNTLRQVIAEPDLEYLTNLTDEQIKYLQKIYKGVPNRKDKKMYMAAQELIWEYMSSYNVYWTDNKGVEINLETEKNKILNTDINEEAKPNIEKNITGKYYEEIIKKDKNLMGYEVENDTKNIITLNNDELKIKIKENGTFTLTKKIIGETPEIYMPLNSSHLIIFTDKQSTEKYNISLTNSKTSFLKLQFTYNNKQIEGIIKFELDNKVYETNNLGYFLSTNTYKLEKKKIKILSIPDKYDLKEKEFNIDLKENLINDNQTLEIKKELEPKKGSIKIKRLGTTNNKIKSLSDIEYSLYAKEDIILDNKVIYKKDKRILESKTDENGVLQLEDLFLGKYYLKEETDTEYIKLDKFEILLTESNNIYDKELSSLHTPLNIKIEDNSKNKYYLYKDNIRLQELEKENILHIDYGKYKVVVLNDDKIIQNINIDFQKQSANYTLYIELKENPIIFEMPKTGTPFKFNKTISLEKKKYEF